MQRIFIGDVQGCADEFDDLISKATGALGNEFSLWIAGDLINRGPDNRRPLERVRELVEAGRAEYVLGNHEIFLLEVGLGLRDLRRNDSVGDILSPPDAAEWIDWIRARPLVVPGRIEGQAFAMVHAASSPDWTLDELVAQGRAISARLAGSREDAADFLKRDREADPVRDALARITRCRSIDAQGGWSSSEPERPEQAWHRVWAARGHDFGLVFGHWARQGLYLAPGLRGLDTGCVHHGRGRDGFLTAWLPESPAVHHHHHDHHHDHDRADSDRAGLRPFDTPDERFWQIPAHRRYYYAKGESRDAS